MTGKLHVFRFLDEVAGFRIGRTCPLRYQVLDSGKVSLELGHVADGQPRADTGPLMLSAEEFQRWFEPVA